MGVLVTVTRPDIQAFASDGHSPSGLWSVQLAAVGDASGGNLEVRFDPELAYLKRFLWSTEGWVYYGTDVVSAFTWDTCRGTPGGTKVLTFATPRGAMEVGGAATIPGDLPTASLGRLIVLPTRAATTAWMRLLIVNGAGRSIDLTIWGFLWDRSVLTIPGGPHRVS